MGKTLFFGGLCLLLITVTTNCTFVVPIIPDFLLTQGISFSLIGLILSFYQISYFFTSLYMGKRLYLYSKNNVMLIGQISLIISNFAIGFLNYGLSAISLIILSSILRFFQGISLALVCSAIYSYVPILFPLDLDKKYAIIEISLGTGMALGPVIGGFFYQYIGYTWAFTLISLIYLLITLILFPFIMRYKVVKNIELITSDFEDIIKSKPIKSIKIVKNKNFLLTFWVFVFSYISYYLIQPGFSDHIHSYKGSDDIVGAIFGLGDLTYALTGFLLLKFFSVIHLKRKYFFIFGGLMSLLSLLILGPEEYTYLPQNLITVTIGMGVLGFAQMFYTATLIPEFIEILKEIDSNAIGNEELACGLFNASLALTEFIGAILGGVLSDEFGFSRGMTVYAIFLFGFLIIYAIFRKYKTKINGGGKPLLQMEVI